MKADETIVIKSANPMWWRSESAAYDAGCIGQWHTIPGYRKTVIVAVHEMKQALQAEVNKEPPPPKRKK